VSTGMPPGKDHFKWVEFLADLVVLKSKGIDVILGMDWLSQHHGLISCTDKVVHLTNPDEIQVTCHTRRHRPDIMVFNIEANVTEPPKIVPYYRLSRSTWPLSNNKELFCRFHRVKPDKSHTTGSLICAKPTRRRDQSTTSHYIKVHKFNIITNQVFHT
jgi:hypothetical protein